MNCVKFGTQFQPGNIIAQGSSSSDPQFYEVKVVQDGKIYGQPLTQIDPGDSFGGKYTRLIALA
jgi:hypothetical protein